MGVFDSVVVTGGSGMLAHALGDELRARGVTAHLISRRECDISQQQHVQALFEKYRPTLLLNCAAHTKVDQCEDEPELANAINGFGPRYLAEMALKYQTRLAHFSTDFVFNGQSDRPYLPSDMTAPVSAYGASKRLGEISIQNVNPPGWLTVRTAWLFGRHGHCFPSTVLNLARSGKTLKVVDDQIGSPTYTVDLARTTLELLDRGAHGIYHVTNSGFTSWYRFAKAVLEVFGVPAELLPLTTSQWVEMRPKQAQRPAYSVLDCMATEKVTGMPLQRWDRSLAKFCEACEVTE